MTRRRFRGALAGLLTLALIGGGAISGLRPLLADDEPLVVAATLPWWDPRGAASLHAAVSSGAVQEAGPVWASPTADGGLALAPAVPAAALIVGSGGRLLPTIQNYVDDAWQGDVVAAILADPVASERHRRLLVDLAREHDWDGVEIDYGNLPPTAGPSFVEFLGRLRDQLHDEGRDLIVTVPARVSDEERAEALAYSYQALGNVSDQLRLRTHFHAWEGSAPGPVAPLSWLQDVVAYAVERVPREKLMLGLATYGFDWGPDRGVELQTADALALASELGVRPQWNAAAAAHTFSYVEDGVEHTVWFEDSRSVEQKYALAEREGLRGVAIWRLGGEDWRLWDVATGAGDDN